MAPPAWQAVPLTRRHDRKAFDCGVPELNTYLARYARQNHESGGAKTFVAVLDAERQLVLPLATIAEAIRRASHGG